jgi:hypothetical protein
MVQILEKEGLDTQLLDLKHTKQKARPPLGPFDGILVGSGIKMFRWVGNATTFLKARRRAQSAQSERAGYGCFRELWIRFNPGDTISQRMLKAIAIVVNRDLQALRLTLRSAICAKSRNAFTRIVYS